MKMIKEENLISFKVNLEKPKNDAKFLKVDVETFEFL